jgi:hypothetical protein
MEETVLTQTVTKRDIPFVPLVQMPSGIKNETLKPKTKILKICEKVLKWYLKWVKGILHTN